MHADVDKAYSSYNKFQFFMAVQTMKETRRGTSLDGAATRVKYGQGLGGYVIIRGGSSSSTLLQSGDTPLSVFSASLRRLCRL
jgi:hypothetical protein